MELAGDFPSAEEPAGATAPALERPEKNPLGREGERAK